MDWNFLPLYFFFCENISKMVSRLNFFHNIPLSIYGLNILRQIFFEIQRADHWVPHLFQIILQSWSLLLNVDRQRPFNLQTWFGWKPWLLRSHWCFIPSKTYLRFGSLNFLGLLLFLFLWNYFPSFMFRNIGITVHFKEAFKVVTIMNNMEVTSFILFSLFLPLNYWVVIIDKRMKLLMFLQRSWILERSSLLKFLIS